MEFPMERKFGQDVEALPHPNDDRQARVAVLWCHGNCWSLTGYYSLEGSMSSLSASNLEGILPATLCCLLPKAAGPAVQGAQEGR